MGKRNLFTLALFIFLSITYARADINRYYSATIKQGETYLLGCTPYSTSGTYDNTLKAVNNEDSIIHLTLTVDNSVMVRLNKDIELGQSYLFGCHVITPAAVTTPANPERDTLILENYQGGDSIICLALNVKEATKPSVMVRLNKDIELGQSYLFGCHVITPAAVTTPANPERDTLILENYQGGDSIICLALNVKPATKPSVMVRYEKDIELGQNYLFGCKVLTPTAVTTTEPVRDTLIFENYQGGDSTICLALNVKPATKPSVMVRYEKDIELGQNYLFGCKVLTPTAVTTTEPVRDTLILENYQGGDSTICLALNVKPATKPSVMVRYEKDIELGQNYLFGCKVLTPTAVTTTEPVRDTLILENYQGGDSTICLALNVKPATKPSVMVRYEKDIELGQNYLFGCKVLTPTAVTTTEPVRDTLILENYQGGDSIICLALNVKPATKPSVMVRYEKDIELGQKYLFGCKVLTPDAVTTPANPVRDTLILENYQGGDSIICLALNVTNPCPAVIVVEDTVATVCEKDLPFLWHGMSLKKDTINCDDTLFNATAHGCDSIVRLQLIVLPYAHGIDQATGCDSVTYKGIKYFASTTVYDTIVGGAANGCDSIVTVTITINKASKSEVTIVECGSYTWNEKEYTKSGDYTFTTTNAAGCDSVATLHLTIKELQYTTIKDSSCVAYKWAGKTYEPDTVAIDTVITAVYPAANGCDSVVTLHLHLYPIIEEQVFVDTACVSYTWSVNKKTYTESTTVTETLESINGCDSVLTLHLTILQPGIRDTAATECNLYTWRDVTYINDTIVFDTIYGDAANGCDSIVRLTLHINKPYKYELDLVSKYGDRLLMINRTQVNTIMADTLDRYKDTTLVRWYREALPEDIFLCYGYYYTNAGKPVDPGVYYALIDIPGTNGECGTKAETEHYMVSAQAGAPALMPTLVRPGENIQVMNLDPAQKTVIRIFTSEGLLQRTYTTNGESSFTIQAADYHGFYLVELSDENMQTTLRYIVQ